MFLTVDDDSTGVKAATAHAPLFSETFWSGIYAWEADALHRVGTGGKVSFKNKECTFDHKKAAMNAIFKRVLADGDEVEYETVLSRITRYAPKGPEEEAKAKREGRSMRRREPPPALKPEAPHVQPNPAAAPPADGQVRALLKPRNTPFLTPCV